MLERHLNDALASPKTLALCQWDLPDPSVQEEKPLVGKLARAAETSWKGIEAEFPVATAQVQRGAGWFRREVSAGRRRAGRFGRGARLVKVGGRQRGGAGWDPANAVSILDVEPCADSDEDGDGWRPGPPKEGEGVTFMLPKLARRRDAGSTRARGALKPARPSKQIFRREILALLFSLPGCPGQDGVPGSAKTRESLQQNTIWTGSQWALRAAWQWVAVAQGSSQQCDGEGLVTNESGRSVAAPAKARCLSGGPISPRPTSFSATA